jgi:hypothetical protein
MRLLLTFVVLAFGRGFLVAFDNLPDINLDLDSFLAGD